MPKGLCIFRSGHAWVSIRAWPCAAFWLDKKSVKYPAVIVFNRLLEGKRGSYLFKSISLNVNVITWVQTRLLRAASGTLAITPQLCLWCNGYRRRKWTRRHEFKSWTRLIAFHIPWERYEPNYSPSSYG